MAQFSVEIIHLSGSLLSANQHFWVLVSLSDTAAFGRSTVDLERQILSSKQNGGKRAVGRPAGIGVLFRERRHY